MEIIAIYSENYTKHIHTKCGQNVKFLNVKAGGKYRCRYHWILKGYSVTFPQQNETKKCNDNTEFALVKFHVPVTEPCGLKAWVLADWLLGS
jgi:hypothetical protein